MFTLFQDNDATGSCTTIPTSRALRCAPLILPQHQETAMFLLPHLGCCNMFPSPTLKNKMLQSVLLPTPKAVMCGLCYKTILRLRLMPCVLRHAMVAAEAIRAKQVDQDPQPQPEDAALHLPQPVLFPHLPQDAEMCSHPPAGYNVTYHRHRMMQCVLPDFQLAEQAGKVMKVDQTPLPLPGTVSLSVPGYDSVCDQLLVINGQRGQVFSVFLLSHTPRRFFSQTLLLPFPLLTSPLPSPATLLNLSPVLPAPGCMQQDDDDDQQDGKTQQIRKKDTKRNSRRKDYQIKSM